jgi:hypothetical protein
MLWNIPLSNFKEIYTTVQGTYKYTVKFNQYNFFFNLYSGGWNPRSTRHCGHCASPGWYDDGEIGGMIGRGNRSTQRKPAPVPLCPPQTPNAARTLTRAPAVGSQRLTGWATARPTSTLANSMVCLLTSTLFNDNERNRGRIASKEIK